MRIFFIFMGIALNGGIHALSRNTNKHERDQKVSHKECAIEAEVRMDCGYYGITQNQCYARDCCWTESNLPGVPWCYHTVSQSSEVCIAHESEREDCGYYGIQSEECTAAGCCWRPSQVSNTPWCFFPSGPLLVEDSCGSPAVSPSVISRIVGGEDAMPHSWPWQVSISIEEMGHFCGGTLISPRWVVTAAHCATVFDDPTVSIRLGIHNKALNDESTEVDARIEAHFEQDFDYFANGGLDNDIALIKLDRDIEYTPEISPACLPRAGEELSAGTDCYTSGWGTLSSGGMSPDILQQAFMPVLDRTFCNSTGENIAGKVTENMVCAGYEDGRIGSCHGDSGGPFVCSYQGHWVLYGAVSWGDPGCNAQVLYSRVSSYVDWIDQIMAENP